MLVSFRLRTLLGVVFLVGTLLGSCLWVRDRSLRQARESACNSHLTRIWYALMEYNDYFSSLPPAYTVDEHGRRLHSWRVLLLPFLDRPDLYRRFRLDEPWDSATNIALLKEMPPEYQCRNDRAGCVWATSYFVVVGTRTLFPGEHTFSLQTVTEPSRNVLALVVEMHESRIPWTKPNDVEIGELTLDDFVKHLGRDWWCGDLGGSGIAMADGTVVRIRNWTAEGATSTFLLGLPKGGADKRDQSNFGGNKRDGPID